MGGVIYHVINRGNGRMKIFRKPGDYLSFVKLLIAGKQRVPMDQKSRGQGDNDGCHLFSCPEMVPGIQNLAQGGYLSVFYRYQLDGAPEPFLVVPVPI